MLDCAVAGMGSILSAHVNGGVPAAPVGNAAASGAPSSGLFPTRTSPLPIVANTEAQFAALCGVLGRPELVIDPRFREPADPQAEPGGPARDHRAPAWPSVRRSSGNGRWPPRAFRPARCARSPRCSTRPHVAARGLLRRLALPGQGREAALPTAGFKLNGSRVAPEQAPPLLGADNESVLAELGYDAAQRRALRDDGVW